MLAKRVVRGIRFQRSEGAEELGYVAADVPAVNPTRPNPARRVPEQDPALTACCSIVEQPADLVSLERTHEYRGLYHVLGGSLSPIDGVEPEHLRIDELMGRVDRNGIQEVVLATNPNMTGEATAAYLADRLRGRVRVTRLASGLPVGGDLEYADEVTLGRALSGRREM